MCWGANAKMIAEPMSAGRLTSKDASGNTMQESVLLYSERCKTRSEAMSREWNIKHDRKFRTNLRATIRTG
jgi:hypothetical protein